ncbi:MAG: ABC transporter, permease protein 2 (cluster 5, nickel/peptides/opines) [uncultured Thermomicrobiales bacterium]|jgi:peptide/nickel transport system permease protein|uniref:ABC transporter, permease protein 2 (Cluster 5, nickel/peptides/opines) n=1 Tax=uncultured Thermomicrobiales bacterium TaxID=1645740 RepID=A0A6J4UPY8_9BACT|nr:MAG: ABC transporter, permease protein 2 (cluster 5, nickel/peptides/opines) [uncultured Thermomicrobiales bacterium]
MTAGSTIPAPGRLREAGGLSSGPLERLGDLWGVLRRSKLALIGLAIVGVLVVLAIVGPTVAPYDPNDLNVRQRSLPPSLNHPFGTDDRGRDVLSRVLYGARVSLQVAVIAVGISATLGVLLGAVSGYLGGWVDELIMRFTDILFAFPGILLAIAIMGVLGPSVTNAMIALGIVYTPIFARITRGSVLVIRSEVFVEAARSSGAAAPRIVARHVMPNVVAPIIVETTLSLAFAILAEAALSFLGLGTPPPAPSWGRMLSEGRSFIQDAPWMGIFPGLAIVLTVMGFNFLGDGLRDALDPRLKGVFDSAKDRG